MYNPSHFRQESLEQMHGLIRDYPFAALVTADSGGLTATHLPLLLRPEPAPNGTLVGHVARANLQWKTAGDALVIFSGPHEYISPSWYKTKEEHGRVVPTWNYVAVHATGPLITFEDPDRLLRVVTELTEQHESSRPHPWRVSDAPAEYTAGLLRAIVGIEIPIRTLEGKWKLSQNRPAEDRAAVVRALEETGTESASSMAALMRELK